LPCSSPFEENCGEGFEGKTWEWTRVAKIPGEKIGELKVNVSCTLGHSHMAGREVLHMKVNDVIPLEQRPDDPVVICVEGIPKFKGHLGAFRQNKAVRIDERLNRG
jgi:flagellar motor switch protein FliM